jgi:diaminohydroxyphosphoribosylaminopyrimidine deaminase/5-amino-6-(5-phosphoribosylamino)uracil reductase
MAAPDKSSKWISSPKGLAFAHRLRYQSDAILVGIETVLADNPRLTARTPSGRVLKEPIRVILDSRLRLPLDALLITKENPAKTWVFCASNHDALTRKALVEKGVRVFIVNEASGSRGLDLKEVLTLLYSKGVVNLLIEGGSRVVSSFVLSGLYDKLYVNIAPKIIGKHGVPFIQETGFLSIQDVFTLNLINLRRNGTDILAVLKKGS